MTEAEARGLLAEARKPMDIDEAISVLRRNFHRGHNDWAQEVLRPDKAPRIVTRDHEGYLRGPTFDRFETIAIAQRYVNEGL